MSSITYLAFTLMTVMLCFHQAIGFHIAITPSTYTDVEIIEYESDVQIACVLDDTDSDKQALALEIEKDGETIASTWRGRSFPFVKTKTNSYEVHGQIDLERTPRAFLNVIIHSPKNEDSGIYQCCLRFLDKSEVMSDVCAIKQLTVDIPDLLKLVRDMNSKLNDMTSLVSALQSEQKEQASQVNQMMKKVDFVEDSASNAVYNVAFSAALSLIILLNKGNVIFDEVVTNIGDGYDPKTGVFTAPRHGIYVFHLVMRSYIDKGNCHNPDCTVRVDLMADDSRLAQAIIEHPEDAGDDLDSQSSVTSVVELQRGVKVSANMIDRMKWYPNKTTMFSGFLLKAI